MFTVMVTLTIAKERANAELYSGCPSAIISELDNQKEYIKNGIGCDWIERNI